MNQDENNSILVVDDDPLVLESTSRLLSGFGYRVFPYGKAADAAMKLREHKICVVLTDFMMPEVNGLQFLDMVRSFNSEIPVIMMTAYAELETAIDAIRKGAFDYLLKPFKSEYLAHSVKKAADHYRLKQLLGTTSSVSVSFRPMARSSIIRRRRRVYGENNTE